MCSTPSRTRSGSVVGKDRRKNGQRGTGTGSESDLHSPHRAHGKHGKAMAAPVQTRARGPEGFQSPSNLKEQVPFKGAEFTAHSFWGAEKAEEKGRMPFGN